MRHPAGLYAADMAAVLIVDDDSDTREVLARHLRKAGHAVASAPNGRAAMSELSTHAPDVVVLDYRMPEMDGVSFLEVIRCYLRWANLPVILLTGFGEGLHIRRANELGVRKIFLKADYQIADLLAHIEACAAGGGSGAEGDSNAAAGPRPPLN